jgi:hypothetical protein
MTRLSRKLPVPRKTFWLDLVALSVRKNLRPGGRRVNSIRLVQYWKSWTPLCGGDGNLKACVREWSETAPNGNFCERPL